MSELMVAVADLIEMHDGRCDSCGCEVAPEGYCGCAPMRDTVLYARRCETRTRFLTACGVEERK